MRWMIRVWTVVFCLWALPSYAAVLDPWVFTSLGSLNASETVNINTDMLVLTGGATYASTLCETRVNLLGKERKGVKYSS